MLQNIVDFKVKSFLNERNTSTIAYEVKAVRALWDPSLSIPGTSRRGGWRCPTGTRYGGQITDRFGRSCGWGVARRIANMISDVGTRLENNDDNRRGRRIARRERRIIGRLNNEDGRAGRLERGLRGVAERLDGGVPSLPSGERRRTVTPRPPSVDSPDTPRELTPAKPAPRDSRRRRAPNLRESEQRRMEREIEQPGAPRTGEAPARRPQRGAPARQRRRNLLEGEPDEVLQGMLNEMRQDSDYKDSDDYKQVMKEIRRRQRLNNRRRRAVVEATKKPKAPVKKPEAVVEPKVVKPRRPKPKVDLREPDAGMEEALNRDESARRRRAEKPAPVRKNVDIGVAPKDFVPNGVGRWRRGSWFIAVDRDDERVLGLTASNGRGGIVLARNFDDLVERMNRVDRRPKPGNSDNAALRRPEKPVPVRRIAPELRREFQDLMRAEDFDVVGRILMIQGNNFPSQRYENLQDEWDEGEAGIKAVEENIENDVRDEVFGENFADEGMQRRRQENGDEIRRLENEIETQFQALHDLENASGNIDIDEKTRIAGQLIYNIQERRKLQEENGFLADKINDLDNRSTPSSVRRMNDTIDSGEISESSEPENSSVNNFEPPENMKFFEQFLAGLPNGNEFGDRERQILEKYFMDKLNQYDNLLDLQQDVRGGDLGDRKKLLIRVRNNEQEIANTQAQFDGFMSRLRNPSDVNRRSALEGLANTAALLRRYREENKIFQEEIDRLADKKKNRARGAGQKINDLNEVLNDRNFGGAFVAEYEVNDRLTLVNDPKNFPNDDAGKRRIRDNADRNIADTERRLRKIEDAITRGDISEADFVVYNRKRYSIARIKEVISSNRDGWKEILDANNVEEPVVATSKPKAPKTPAVNPASVRPKLDNRNIPKELQHTPPKVEPAEFSQDEKRVLEQALLEIRDLKNLGKFSLFVDKANFLQNEARQDVLRQYQKTLSNFVKKLIDNPDMPVDQVIASVQQSFLPNAYVRPLALSSKIDELRRKIADKVAFIKDPIGGDDALKETFRLRTIEELGKLKAELGQVETYLQLSNLLEPEMRKAALRREQGYVFNPDATNFPKPDLAQLQKQIKDKIKVAIERRQGKLTKYLQERHPNGGAIYESMTPAIWQTLSLREKNDYIKKAYSHDMIKGKNGKLYRAQASVSGNSIEVNFDEINAQGQVLRARIANSSRSLHPREKYVKQSTLFVHSELDRGADIQTIYNQHAFLYLSKIGYNAAKVGPVQDGTYVWARVGFKSSSPLTSFQLQQLNEPLKFYEDFGSGGLISNDAEYARLKQIQAQAREGKEFYNQDVIFALDDPTGDRQRMEYQKKWFVRNMPQGSGKLKFKDEGIAPAVRRRRAAQVRQPSPPRPENLQVA